VNALKAHVVKGQIVLDEPAELPEGAELKVYLFNAQGDGLSDDDRAALHDSLRRGIAQADAGTLIDADVVLAELERGRA
jgi:hypothetical protein